MLGARTMRLLFTLLVTLTVGCRQSTSVVVRIDARDLTVPDQIAALKVRVTNPEIDAVNPTFDSQVLPLCSIGNGAKCYSLPLSVALRPGDAQPNALVRVEVLALDSAGMEVVHDAARFRFLEGATQEIDFHLSPACLNTYCAARDRTCGPNGGCIEPVVGGAADAGSPLPPGKIERWYQNSASTLLPAPTLAIDQPSNVRAGDLILALVPSGPPMAGWNTVIVTPRRRLVYHRAVDGETSDAYVFSGVGSAPFGDWMEASYRGVSEIVIGTVIANTTDGTFPMTSMDVMRAGAWLTTWIGKGQQPRCLRDGQGEPAFHAVQNQIDEQRDLQVGPTGDHVFDCGGMGTDLILGAEVLLIP